MAENQRHTEKTVVLPYHLAQIAAFCHEHPTKQKIVFAPSRQVGNNILTALTRRGIAWVNIEIMSIADHAERNVGPELQSQGLQRISADSILLVVAGLLSKMKAATSGSYFEPVAVTPSLARSVWLTLSSMRLAGIGHTLVEERIRDPKKRDALSGLLRGFEDELRSRNLYDTAKLLLEAQRITNDSRTVAAILEESTVGALERRYLDRAFGDALTVIGRPDFGLADPEGTARSIFKNRRAFEGVVGQGGKIKTGGLVPADGRVVVAWGARGPEMEVADALSWVLSNGIPLDDVEIAHTRSSTYVPLLVDAADRHGVELALAEGYPANLTRPGRGLTGFLQWISDGYPATALASLLQGDLFRFESVADASHTSSSVMASLLLEAPIGEGIARYHAALEPMLRTDESRLQSVDPNSAFGRRLGRRVRDISGLMDAFATLKKWLPAGTTTSFAAAAKLATIFLERYTVMHGERDKRAQESLTDRVAPFLDVQDELPTRFVLQVLAEMVTHHTIQVSTAKPGALHVTNIERAGYSGRGHLFVIGLDVDSFPGRSGEDPILLDLERARVSNKLGQRSTQAGDAIWHLLRVLGMSTERVFLSSTVFNAEREDSIVYPSPLFQTVVKQLGHDYENPPPLKGARITLDNTSLLVPQRDRHDFRNVVGRLYPWLVDGQIAADARRRPELTRFDGWLGKGHPEFQITTDYPIFSNTRLERLANCGYRYFLYDVLKLRKPEYYKLDPARWLSAKDYGILLHDLYHDFLKTLADRSETFSIDRHSALIFSLLGESIASYERQIPIDNLAAHDHEIERLKRSAFTFLRTESLSDSRPERFELVFGYPDASDDSIPEPVLVDLGEGVAFRLAGRVDRIDSVPDGLIIWDYKTGSSWKFKQDGLFRGGLNLQWALYAEAVNRLAGQLQLKGPVIKSGYYFASDRENGLQIAESPPSIEELRHVIRPLIELVNTGAFLKVNKDENACNYCDFKTICSSESIKSRAIETTMEMNAGQPFSSSLEQWVRN